MAMLNVLHLSHSFVYLGVLLEKLLFYVPHATITYLDNETLRRLIETKILSFKCYDYLILSDMFI